MWGGVWGGTWVGKSVGVDERRGGRDGGQGGRMVMVECDGRSGAWQGVVEGAGGLVFIPNPPARTPARRTSRSR